MTRRDAGATAVSSRDGVVSVAVLISTSHETAVPISADVHQMSRGRRLVFLTPICVTQFAWPKLTLFSPFGAPAPAFLEFGQS